MVIIRMNTQSVLHSCLVFTLLAVVVTNSEPEDSGQIIKLLVHPGQIVSVLDSDMFSKIFKNDIKILKSSTAGPLGRYELDKLSKIFNISSYTMLGNSTKELPSNPLPRTPSLEPTLKEAYPLSPPPYYITVNPPTPELPRRSIPLPSQTPVFSRKSFKPAKSPPSFGQIIRDLRNFKKAKLDKWLNKNKKKEVLYPYPYTVTYPATLYPNTPTISVPYPTTTPTFHPSELDINIVNTTKQIKEYEGKYGN